MLVLLWAVVSVISASLGEGDTTDASGKRALLPGTMARCETTGEGLVVVGCEEDRKAVLRYDEGAWKRLPDLPVAADHASAVVFEDVLYVIIDEDKKKGPQKRGSLSSFFSGLKEEKEIRNRHWALNLSSSYEWTSKTSFSIPRRRASFLEHDGSFYAIGGEISRKLGCASDASLEKYDVTSNTWQLLPALPDGLSRPSFLISKPGQGFMVAGGFVDQPLGCRRNHTEEDDHQILFFDTAKKTWHRLEITEETCAGLSSSSREEKVLCAWQKETLFAHEERVTWFDGGLHDVRREALVPHALELEKKLLEFWREDYRKADEATEDRFVNLTNLCDGFENALQHLTLASIFEVLANFSLRPSVLRNYEADRGYIFFLAHWFGVCASRRAQDDSELLGWLATDRAAFGAFRAHFDSNLATYSKVFHSSDTLRPDDACVFLRRELAPSFAHGIFWDKFLQATTATGGLQDLILQASTVNCQANILDHMTGDCLHGLGHGIALSILDSIDTDDNHKKKATENIRVPVQGAYFRLRHHPLILETIKNTDAALSNKGSRHTSPSSAPPAWMLNAIYTGIRHSMSLYTKYNPTNASANRDAGFVYLPKRFAPFERPCDFSRFADADSNFNLFPPVVLDENNKKRHQPS